MSSSTMVTVAMSAPVNWADQPVTLVAAVTVKVSSSSSSKSTFVGMLKDCVLLPAGTVTMVGTAPTSSADALPAPVW